MPDARRRVPRALLGLIVACVSVLGVATPAAAAVEDCGGGELMPIQDADDPRTIVGVQISDVGLDCDGQPVGVQFLGNEAGDPALPASELAHAYSDEDPCTGADRPDGVLRAGAVEVLLCEDSTTAGYVDGRQLTQLRLITTLEAPAAPAGPGEPAAAPDSPDPAPAPDQPTEDLPMTGADVLRAALLGAALVVAGTALTRLARSRRHLVG